MKLDVKKQATSRPSLEPIMKDGKYLFGGNTPGYLSSVTFGTQKHEKGEFAGMEVPMLVFEFTNYKLNKSDVDKFHTHSEKIIGCKVHDGDDLVDMDVAKVDEYIEQMFLRIKAIFQGFRGTANYREIENVTEDELNKYFDLPSTGDPAVRIAKFTQFFKFLEDFFNKGGKSMNKDDKNNLIPIFIRLEPEYKHGRYYMIPTYPEKGIIEVIKFGANREPIDPQVLRIKVPLELKTGKSSRTAGASIPGAPGSDDDIDALIKQSQGQ